MLLGGPRRAMAPAHGYGTAETCMPQRRLESGYGEQESGEVA